MSRWAIVAIPLMLCLVLMEAVVRQFIADRALAKAGERLADYERETVVYSRGEGGPPTPIAYLGSRLKRAVKLEPRSAEYRSCLGRYYQALATNASLSDEGRLKLAGQAIEQYEEAVRLDPVKGEHYARLAWMQGATGEHEKAVENFERAMRLNPSNEWISEVYEVYRKWVTSPDEAPKPGAGK